MQTDYHDLFSRHVHNLSEHLGGELRGLCPFHDDTSPSWAGNRSTGLWKCFGCGAQGNAEQFAQRVGEVLEMGERKIVATYDYKDETGKLLFQVVRYELSDGEKAFSQRRPDNKGGWITGRGCLKGVRRVLYRLPELLSKATVFMVEGEKDCDRLWSLGIPATTSPMGAKNWHPEYAQYLADKKVVILPDNDGDGERYALDAARSLIGVAEAVKIVRLPGLPQKGDVSDWLDTGHTREELAKIVKATLTLRPEGLPPEEATEQKPKGLALTKLRDLLSEPEEEVSWLVEGLLPSGGLSAVVAKPKVGKSTLARNLALVVAQGQNFFGRPTRQGPVIYLALEEKRSEVRKHFQEMGATGEEDIYMAL